MINIVVAAGKRHTFFLITFRFTRVKIIILNIIVISSHIHLDMPLSFAKMHTGYRRL